MSFTSGDCGQGDLPKLSHLFWPIARPGVGPASPFSGGRVISDPWTHKVACAASYERFNTTTKFEGDQGTTCVWGPKSLCVMFWLMIRGPRGRPGLREDVRPLDIGWLNSRCIELPSVVRLLLTLSTKDEVSTGPTCIPIQGQKAQGCRCPAREAVTSERYIAQAGHPTHTQWQGTIDTHSRILCLSELKALLSKAILKARMTQELVHANNGPTASTRHSEAKSRNQYLTVILEVSVGSDNS